MLGEKEVREITVFSTIDGSSGFELFVLDEQHEMGVDSDSRVA